MTNIPSGLRSLAMSALIELDSIAKMYMQSDTKKRQKQLQSDFTKTVKYYNKCAKKYTGNFPRMKIFSADVERYINSRNRDKWRIE